MTMAGKIPPAIIEEVRQRTDIVALIGEYVVLKRTGRNFMGLCPFHTEDTPSFSVVPEKQIYYCFGCHKAGNAINFLMEIEHLTFPEAVEKLAERCGVTIEKRELTPAEERAQQETAALFRLNQLAGEFYQRQLRSRSGKQAFDYLNRRGVNDAMLEKFQLGFAPDSWDSLTNYLQEAGFAPDLICKAGLAGKSSKDQNRYYDKFRGRVMFPIHDYKGHIVAFGGRTLTEQGPKYLNTGDTPIFNKSQTLYGLWFAGQEIRRQDSVVLMEGYMDVIAAHQYGVENAVASLGTALTVGHGRLLRRYTTNVMLAYDGDSAGTHANLRGLDILRDQGFQIKVVPMPQNQDPDDFLRQEGRSGWEDRIADHGMGLLEYKMEQAFLQHDSDTIDGKGAIVRSLLPEIMRQKNQVEQDLFVQLLAKRLGISASSIYMDLQKQGYTAPAEIASPTKVENAFPSTEQGREKICRDLVKYMLENEEVFVEVQQEIGIGFPKKEAWKELLSLVANLKDEYHFDPASLFSHLPEGDAKEALIELLALPETTEDIRPLAEGCLRALRTFDMQREIEKVQAALRKPAPTTDTKELARELIRLQQQVRDLRQRAVLQKRGN